MTMQVYGLLHLAENEQSAMNVSTKNFRDQASIYVNNAIALSTTLQSQGIPFTLLVNKKDLVESYTSAHPNASSLQIQEIPFSTTVPAGIKFYSAHFKLDVFRYLATLESGYLALCDLDVVCINDVPRCLHNIVQAGIPLYYDISDHVIPAYGHEVIIRDLKTLHGLDSEGRWYGGEFISGTPAFFNLLVQEINRLYGNYLSHIDTLRHVGDEAITSAALEKLRRQGVAMSDAGSLGIVGRYWNTTVLHPQKPFAYFNQCFLLHLPADKKILADLSQTKNLTASDFKQLYGKCRISQAKRLKKWVYLLLQSLRGLINWQNV